MLKNVSLIAIIIIVGILTSCTFTEKIYVNEDGSGSYSLDMDLGQIMQYTKNLSKSLGEDEKTVDEIAAQLPKKMDTIINFTEMVENDKEYNTLSADQKEFIQSLKGSTMHLRLDEKKDEMLMSFLVDFKKISDLKDMQNKVSNAAKLTNKDQTGMLGSLPNTNQTVYEYSNNTFSRSVIKLKQTKAQQEEIEKSMQQMAMFLAGSEYRMEYHFPKAIKSTTAQNASFSEDRKTLFISHPFSSILENESLIDFEVKF